jgi:tetratricopeptide (TPR) repeat protein
MVQERPVRVERRLAAIVAADVAGYSRLMHHDEEATHAKLTSLLADGVTPAISEHGGRIVKNTGDGFLAEFPSAVEAVRAAVQFQTRIRELTVADAEDRRIVFRVGVNIGDVIVEPQGAAWVNKGRTPEQLAQARGFFDRALALEPGNVEALAGIALVNAAISASYLTDDRIEHLTAAEAAATKALSLAPNHPLAHNVLGLVQTFANRAAQGIANCERALALDRNLAQAHANIGLAKLFLGRGGETEAHI